MSFYIYGSGAEYYSASSFLNVFLLLTFGVEGVYDCEGRGRRMGRGGGENIIEGEFRESFCSPTSSLFYPDNKEELS
jgi:hypothetical protein